MTATILIIDDDLDIVRLLEQDMKDEGYAVVTGNDGQMALNLAKTRRPDLIIMDVQMPMTSGIKALEFLRKMPETKDIPIIFLTGISSQVIYPAVENAVRTAYLKKPLDLENLNSLVTQFLQKYPVRRP